MEKVAPASDDGSFPKKFRIRNQKGFRSVFSEGARAHSENFVLYSKPNGLGHPRLGVSVGKKASPSAVRRNRMKRMLREIFRNNKAAFFSNDVVVMVKSDVSRKKSRELLPEITRLAEELE